jgi:hypothetical protein
MKKLACIFLALLFSSNVVVAEELYQDCGDWVNCNPNPPTFNGVCCRICYFPELGWNEWQCSRFSNDIGLSNKEIDSLTWIKERKEQ